jgi:hypothetical protein
MYRSGFLADLRPTCRAFPSRLQRNSGIHAVFVLITVAGRRKIRTSFPVFDTPCTYKTIKANELLFSTHRFTEKKPCHRSNIHSMFSCFSWHIFSMFHSGHFSLNPNARA